MSKVVLKVCVRDEESIHKEKFVRDYLAPLLKAVNPHIVEVEYHKYVKYGEQVIITYRHGYVKEKDVTADSLQALVVDVFKDGI